MRRSRWISPLLIAGMLLTSCQNHPISQQLVVSAMGVDVSESPWQAILEVMQEDESRYYSVSGDNFYEIYSEVEKRYGYPLYLGAVKCIVFSGVKDGTQLCDLLSSLGGEEQIGAGTQIALCDDAISMISKDSKGEEISSLLTGQYMQSNQFCLNKFLNVLLDGDSGMLVPVISVGESGLQIAGYVPSHSGDYTKVWKGNTVSNFLIQRIPRQIQAVSVDGKEVMINFTNFKASGIRISAAQIPVITISLTATVEAGAQNVASREILRQSILDELQRQLREIQNAVVIEGGTDLFFVGRYARWAGNLDEIRLADSKFVIKLDLMDPKLLIRE